MNIKESHQQLEATRHRLWLHSQYLKIYEDQLALLEEQFPGPYLNGRLRYLQDQAER